MNTAPLFAPTDLAPKPRKRRAPLRSVPKPISFGPEPKRTGESASQRVDRMRTESKLRFRLEVCDSIHAKLGLLSGKDRDENEVLRCPHARVATCTAECRCGGKGVVLLGELVAHYRGLLEFMWSLTPKQKPRRKPERFTIP